MNSPSYPSFNPKQTTDSINNYPNTARTNTNNDVASSPSFSKLHTFRPISLDEKLIKNSKNAIPINTNLFSNFILEEELLETQNEYDSSDNEENDINSHDSFSKILLNYTPDINTNNSNSPAPFIGNEIGNLIFNNNNNNSNTSISSISSSTTPNYSSATPYINNISPMTPLDRSISCPPTNNNDFFSLNFAGNNIEKENNEISDTYVPKLRLFSLQSNGCAAISSDVVSAILRNHSCFDKLYDKILILDCRYEFEYKGGHIFRAINITNAEKLSQLLFDFSEDNNEVSNRDATRTLILCHCEFSQDRGPKVWKYIREKDRHLNGVENFPNLFYPELYLIYGGYKKFFRKYPQLCFPSGYVKMCDRKHSLECKRSKSTSKKMFSKCNLLGSRSRSAVPYIDDNNLSSNNRTNNSLNSRANNSPNIKTKFYTRHDLVPLFDTLHVEKNFNS